MKGEILISNIFTLFVIAIILEASVMAIFSLNTFKSIYPKKPIQAARDLIVLGLAFVLCYKVEIITVFGGTLIKLPQILDVVISTLVLTRMTNFIGDVLTKFKSTIDD
jgi:hypothetical protein